MSTTTNYEKEVALQTQTRRAAVEFINIVNDLWYDKSIELVLFRNQLIDKRASEVLNLIKYSEEFVAKAITVFDALDIAKAIQQLTLPSSKLDIGKLAYECQLNEDACADKLAFVKNQLKDAKASENIAPKDVVLYGFGRIGRLLARELMNKMGKGSQIAFKSCCYSWRNQSNSIRKKGFFVKY